jgi:hypothetical protein
MGSAAAAGEPPLPYRMQPDAATRSCARNQPDAALIAITVLYVVPLSFDRA